jgi:cyclopropane-fatty-acyl-phospholipid synthase
VQLVPSDRGFDRDASVSSAREATVKKEWSAASPRAAVRGSVWAVERRLMERVLARIGRPAVSMILWDGSESNPDVREGAGRIVIRDRRAFWKLLVDPLFNFCDLYTTGRIEVEGDFYSVLRSIQTGLHGVRRSTPRQGLSGRWWHRPRGSSLRSAKDNIHRHYDLGNDFYRLWLDDQLVYTCAYFARPDFTLEQAQIAKMDHVCRKLQLRPGQTVIEAGCGWGALALHMARHYGVTVRAFNISKEQVAFARDRAKSEGLERRVEFVLDDWRNITGSCDAFVSVGMLEHAGRSNYPLLGRTIRETLKPEGFALIHSIGQNAPRPFDQWTERRIFPGAYPPSIAEMMSIFEPNALSVLDVENLRLHYAETCRQWLARYEQSVDAVRQMFDERFVRAWRLYLAGSAAAFEAGSLQLFQIVCAHGGANHVPQTREFLYRS